MAGDTWQREKQSAGAAEASLHAFLSWAYQVDSEMDATSLEQVASQIFDATRAGEELVGAVERMAGEQRLQHAVRRALDVQRVGDLIREWLAAVRARAARGSSANNKRVAG